MREITTVQLHGEYNAMLASDRGRRLWHQLRIDKQGGYSSWFMLEVMRNGESTMSEFTGLAQAVRAFNEEKR